MSTNDDPESDDKKMPLLDHLIELRSRLLRCVIALFVAFIVCFYFADHLYAFLVQPLANILAEKGLDRRMIFTALTEVFFTYVKVAFFFGAFISFPIFEARSTSSWRQACTAPSERRFSRSSLPRPFCSSWAARWFITSCCLWHGGFS